jgi:hypothetical protein
MLVSPKALSTISETMVSKNLNGYTMDNQQETVGFIIILVGSLETTRS